MNPLFQVNDWKRRILYTPASNDERSRMRTVVDSLILHLHPVRVPAAALRFSYTWALGGICATLGLLLGLTGVLLMFRYEPNVGRAYLSIQMLETQVVFGSLVRAIHHWSASLLVITTFLHLLRVFFTGGYKQGRSRNWLIGVGLLLVTLLFNFTGYLLPWDQLSYWAVTVSTSLVSYMPLIGRALSRLALAGAEVGQGALSNFYALHVAVLPLTAVALVSYHFWKVRKDGGISQPIGQHSERVTTIPHLVRRELAVAALVVLAVMLWSMAVPAPLEEVANPMQSPNPAKAAWYFVGIQEFLLHMDTLAAIVVVAVVGAALAFLPHFDRQDGNVGVYFRSPIGRRAALLGALLGLDIVPLLVMVDEYWLDLPAMLPPWPTFVANGVIPALATLAGLTAIYGLTRRLLKANHSEALVGLVSFFAISLVMLTIIGNLFRGANMALILPF